MRSRPHAPASSTGPPPVSPPPRLTSIPIHTHLSHCLDSSSFHLRPCPSAYHPDLSEPASPLPPSPQPNPKRSHHFFPPPPTPRSRHYIYSDLARALYLATLRHLFRDLIATYLSVLLPRTAPGLAKPRPDSEGIARPPEALRYPGHDPAQPPIHQDIRSPRVGSPRVRRSLFAFAGQPYSPSHVRRQGQAGAEAGQSVSGRQRHMTRLP